MRSVSRAVWCAVVGCGVIAALTARALLTGTAHSIFSVCLCAVALCVVAAVCSECVMGDGRSVCSVVRHYLSVRCVYRAGRRQRDALERDTLRVRRAQEETLLRTLRDTAHTRYGREYHFSSIKDVSDFRKRHPVTAYGHYEELVRRVACGEGKVVVMETPVLTVTSGSSGCSKMLLNTTATDADFSHGVSVCADVMRETFPGVAGLYTTFRLVHPASRRRSEARRPIRATMGSYELTPHGCTSPADILQVQDECDALYLHLLFALRNRHVNVLESRFSNGLFEAFRYLESHSEELVHDVESGRISSRLVLDPRLRAQLEKRMNPDEVRGAEIRAAISEGYGGVVLRLWPRLHLIHTVDSGPHQIYGESLRQRYCRGVAFYSPLYATPEGLIGVNLWPLGDTRRYLLCPRSMFFEFLPEEDSDGEHTPDDTLLMEEVEEGRNYQLIVTTASGLFRYRLGDVVKVVAFHNQCPVVEFLYRISQTLNVRGEKVNEALFLAALKKAVSQWPGAKLVDYCCAESGILGDSSGGAQPHYQVFLELTGVRNLSEEQRYKLDACLQADCSLYRSFRIKGSIGPMKVQLVGEGAFRQLRDHMISSSHASPDTFQMQRVIRRKEHADFLLRKTVS